MTNSRDERGRRATGGQAPRRRRFVWIAGTLALATLIVLGVTSSRSVYYWVVLGSDARLLGTWIPDRTTGTGLFSSEPLTFSHRSVGDGRGLRLTVNGIRSRYSGRGPDTVVVGRVELDVTATRFDGMVCGRLQIEKRFLVYVLETNDRLYLRWQDHPWWVRYLREEVDG